MPSWKCNTHCPPIHTARVRFPSPIKETPCLYTRGAHHLEEFKAAYPVYKTGTGCINRREKVDTPLEAIAAVIRHAMKYPTGH